MLPRFNAQHVPPAACRIPRHATCHTNRAVLSQLAAAVNANRLEESSNLHVWLVKTK